MNALRLLALLSLATVAQAQGPGPSGRGVDIGPDTQAPVYISGKVVMADGSPTPKEAFAELVCDGFPRATDQLSPSGEFDIDVSGNSAGIADATRASNRASGVPSGNHLGVVNMSNCFVRAELPEHVSSVVPLAQRSQFDNPDIGEVVLTRLEGITGEMVSASLLAAPKKAVKAYEKAKKESTKPDANFEKMESWLEEAVAEEPKLAAAWELLGRVRTGLGKFHEAIDAYDAAIAAEPDFIPPYAGLTPLLVRSGNMERAVEMGGRALELNPHLHEVRFFLAGAQLRTGDNQGCIDTAKTMLDNGAADRYPQAYQFLGAAYANLGDFKAAGKHFRRFLEVSPNATAAERIREELANWEEQGLIRSQP